MVPGLRFYAEERHRQGRDDIEDAWHIEIDLRRPKSPPDQCTCCRCIRVKSGQRQPSEQTVASNQNVQDENDVPESPGQYQPKPVLWREERGHHRISEEWMSERSVRIPVRNLARTNS